MHDLHELPKLRDGLSYLYIEHGIIERAQNAIEVLDEKGRTMVPVAALATLMLGPGTSITHAAIRVLAENGCLVIWSGEEGVRFYAHGYGETRKGYHLLRQAELAGNPDRRMEVVIRMYRFRFGEELARGLSLEQVRGFEGVRVRTAYAEASKSFGVPWHGRQYDRSNWNAGDPVNRALSAANACLNGICHAGIVSGGYSPGLGFIHTGRQLSFVYDIADLYKVETTIPLAFSVVAAGEHQIESRVRHACRDAFRSTKLLDRILPDINHLLGVHEDEPADEPDVDEDMALPAPWWSPPGVAVSGGSDDRDGA